MVFVKFLREEVIIRAYVQKWIIMSRKYYYPTTEHLQSSDTVFMTQRGVSLFILTVVLWESQYLCFTEEKTQDGTG